MTSEPGLRHDPFAELPELRQVRDLPEPSRDAVEQLLLAIHRDAKRRALHHWRRDQTTDAAYWRSAADFALRLRKALRQ
jgi:hypothetical protein